ncbi:MAG: imidazole glycerol phosphate synthase subunit HisH [Clostridiales bacterium]|jgi:glutamine amidotransferase|nr:imidazole glycerol phosphate synthase subunit HisH [Clostridiales bacterium]
MTVIVDYGVGNLFSLCSSLKYIGAEATVSGEADIIRSADRIILPGVGAFGDARAKLSINALDKVVIEEAGRGKPLMGICLGMQMLFDRSYEFGVTDGLGLIEGEVKPIAPIIPKGYKVPHIGWNALDFTEEGQRSPVFKYISEGDYVYFVHSFSAMGCNSSIIASAEYGAGLTAAVQRDNVFGMQFHPEKSGEVGLKILKAFCEL